MCDSYLPPYMAYPKFLMKVDISETAKYVRNYEPKEGVSL